MGNVKEENQNNSNCKIGIKDYPAPIVDLKKIQEIEALIAF